MNCLQPKNCTVTNVFHDNCTVNWQPPDDDGGTEITGYIIEVLSRKKAKRIFRGTEITGYIIYNMYVVIMKYLQSSAARSTNCNDGIFAIFWNIRSLSCDYEIFAIFCNLGAKRQRRKRLEPSCGSWCWRSEGKD